MAILTNKGDALKAERVAASARKIIPRKEMIQTQEKRLLYQFVLETTVYCVIEKPLRKVQK